LVLTSANILKYIQNMASERFGVECTGYVSVLNNLYRMPGVTFFLHVVFK